MNQYLEPVVEVIDFTMENIMSGVTTGSNDLLRPPEGQ